MRQGLVAFAVGVVFAIGLAIAGMTEPANVIGFLDLEAWNPRLLFVMGGAVVVYGLANRLIRARRRPIFAPDFSPLELHDIDARLVIGSAIFGVGWGLSGVCPGPAFASLASLSLEPAIFVVAMLAGTALAKRLF